MIMMAKCINLLVALFAQFLVYEVVKGADFKLKATVTCPCDNLDDCILIRDTQRKEVFAFSVKNDVAHWSKYDWSKITTLVSFGYINDSLMCLAHSHNSRVVYKADLSNVDLTSGVSRERWVDAQVNIIKRHFLDGINFDYKGIVTKQDVRLRRGYSDLVSEANVELKRHFPYFQISVNVGWAPDADVRFYDYKGLSDTSDFLFVTAYQEQSQVFGECLALPNSGYPQTQRGVNSYQYYPIDIDPRKIVLGLPWYGLSYQCKQVEGDKCLIERSPFRGVNCSDVVAKTIGFGEIFAILKFYPEKVMWNETSSTPYVTYRDFKTWHISQLQYDDPKSLVLKYEMANHMGLRGVGMWTVDFLDYSDTLKGKIIRSAMFGALPSYKELK